MLPYTPDAWIDSETTKIGFEISFTRHFYKPQHLRSLQEIRADILALEQETGGMLTEIVGDRPASYRQSVARSYLGIML